MKIITTNSQSECDPRDKFLDTLRNNYEIQIPIYRAASPKTQVVQLVPLGM